MTKERLERYRKDRQKTDILNRLAKDPLTDKVKGSLINHPYTETNLTIEGVDAILAQKASDKNRQLEIEKQAILHFISGIDDVYIASIIMDRFVKNKPWIQIAMQSGGGASESGIRMAVDRFFREG